MGWPFTLKPRRQTIARQAATRLVLSLGLFVIALILSSSWLYNAALNKAAAERADDWVSFYQYRLMQLEQDWEKETRDFKMRIEFTRYLENSIAGPDQLRAFFYHTGRRGAFSAIACSG